MSGSTPAASDAVHVPVRPDAAQHFVGDEEDLVAVADLADPSQVTVARNAGAGRASADRFDDERGYAIGAFLEDRCLERVAGARRTIGGASQPQRYAYGAGIRRTS